MTTSSYFNQHDEIQSFKALFIPSAQDKLFKNILLVLLLVYIAVGIVVPFLEQPQIPRELKEKPPAQLAKIMLKEKQLPLPKKPKIKPKEPPKEKPKKIKVKKKKQPPKMELQQKTSARKKARTSGLATMKDELFAMREAFTVTPKATAKLNNSDTKAKTVKRKLLAAQTHQQSEKLAQANLAQTVTSDAISTKSTQQVRLGKEEIIAENSLAEANTDAKPQLGQRSEMTLRSTLEAHKARLYAIYNRALRKDPLLKGKVLFEIEIQPNGNISHVAIKSSELNNPKLERRLILVLKRIKFPVEDVDPMTTIWAVDFLPS